MRMIYWSSDVCSSDLAFVLHPVDDVHLEPRMQRARILPHQFLDQPRAVLGREVRDFLAELHGACVVVVGNDGANAGIEDFLGRLLDLLVAGRGVRRWWRLRMLGRHRVPRSVLGTTDWKSVV